MSWYTISVGGSPSAPTRTRTLGDGSQVFEMWIESESVWLPQYYIQGPSAGGEPTSLEDLVFATDPAPDRIFDALDAHIVEGIRFADNQEDKVFFTRELKPLVADQRDVVDTTNWSEVNSAKESDNLPATIRPDSDELSTALWVRDFRANLPADAVVTGFKIRVRRKIFGSGAVTADEGNLISRRWKANFTFEDRILPVSNPLDVSIRSPFGRGIALDLDGNAMCVGTGSGTTDDFANLYTRSGSTWSDDDELVGSGLDPSDAYTWHVRLSSDGLTLAATAFNDISTVLWDAGSTFIFVKSGGTWSEQQKIGLSDTVPPIGAGEGFSQGIALSGDGDTLAIANITERDGLSFGVIYVFTRSVGVWTQEQRLENPDDGIETEYGEFMGLSEDGDTLLVMDRWGDGIDFWKREIGVWSHKQDLVVTLGGREFMAMSKNGSHALLRTGSKAWKYIDRTADTWSIQQTIDFSGESSFTPSYGAINDAGNKAVFVSWVGGGDITGQAFIYERSASTWTKSYAIVPSLAQFGGDPAPRFGRDCAMSGDGNYVAIAAKRSSGTEGTYPDGLMVFSL